MQRLMKTSNDAALTVLRVVLGSVFFAHGAQKMLGWFGGQGFTATMDGFQQFLHIPAPLAFLAIAAEFFGGLALIVGGLGRLAAGGIAVTMLVAAALVHARFGFFMNWSGTQKGEGFEYHLLAIAAASVLILRGSGALSLDRLFTKSRSLAAVVAAPERAPLRQAGAR